MFGNNESFNELKKMIDNSAERLYSSVSGIPKIQKEDNISANVKWQAKFFFIAEQNAADEYAAFMTHIIQNPDKYSLLREKENWTPSGELIRIVEYLEKV